MLLSELIATTTDEVGISFLDFYSIGHICMGIGIFMFFSLFYTIQKHAGNEPLIPLWGVFIIVMICAVLWEVVENVFFIQMGLKFEGRMDSWMNMTTDILLVGLGGIGAWIVCYILVSRQKKLLGYYIFGVVSFAMWIGIFLILRWLTYRNTPVFS